MFKETINFEKFQTNIETNVNFIAVICTWSI